MPVYIYIYIYTSDISVRIIILFSKLYELRYFKIKIIIDVKYFAGLEGCRYIICIKLKTDKSVNYYLKQINGFNYFSEFI